VLLVAIKSCDITVDFAAFYAKNTAQLRGKLCIKGDDPEKRMSYQTHSHCCLCLALWPACGWRKLLPFSQGFACDLFSYWAYWNWTQEMLLPLEAGGLHQKTHPHLCYWWSLSASAAASNWKSQESQPLCSPQGEVKAHQVEYGDAPVSGPGWELVQHHKYFRCAAV